jgi:peptidoglycan-associated lipoprotein
VEETFQPPKEEKLTAHDINTRGLLKTVYFAFDSSELTPDAQATLRTNAQWLKANPGYKVLIQGHCDERGTIEYNLALGERRGSAVRDYLANLGIARADMRVVSYGEERPATPGHDESAWSRNRRAEILAED